MVLYFPNAVYASVVLYIYRRIDLPVFIIGSTIPLHREAKALHAVSVLVDRRKAVLGWVGGVGEEHALVPFRLLLLAYAAGLLKRKRQQVLVARGRVR